MAQKMKRTYDLSSLKITLLGAREPPEVRFELETTSGGQTSDIEDVTTSLSDLRFTETAFPALESGTFVLPNRVADRLADRASTSLDPGRPLWLHIAKPGRLLGLVPWERLLQPRLKSPLLRLPDFFLEPARSRTALDIALVANDPLSEPSCLAQRVLRIAERIVADTPLPVFVHVFTDAATYDALPHSGWSSGRSSEILLYDLPDVSEPWTVPSDPIANDPWLRWIRDATVQGQLDVVHFLAHGHAVTGGGALAFTRSPTESAPQSAMHLLGSAELSRFATQVGAWSMVFTSPPGNRSTAGLRLCADDVARLRPISVLFHDLAADLEARALGEAYGFLFAPEPAEPPRTDDLFIYCQPWQVQSEVERGGAGVWYQEAREAATLTIKTRNSLEVLPSTPVWIAATQRYIEDREWQLRHWGESVDTPDPGTSVSIAVDAVRSALDAIKQIVNEYADAEIPGTTPIPHNRVVGRGPSAPRRDKGPNLPGL